MYNDAGRGGQTLTQPVTLITGAGHRIGNFDQAITDLTTAAKLWPDYGFTYSSRAEVYRLKGDYVLAITDSTLAIALDSNDAYAYVIRGATYGTLGDYRKAIADFTRAIELDQAYINRHYHDLIWR